MTQKVQRNKDAWVAWEFGYREGDGCVLGDSATLCMCVCCMFISMWSCLTQICMCLSRSNHAHQIRQSITCETALVSFSLEVENHIIVRNVCWHAENTQKKCVWFVVRHYKSVNPTLFHFLLFISCKVLSPSLSSPTVSLSYNQRFISHLSWINIVSECRHHNINLIE